MSGEPPGSQALVAVSSPTLYTCSLCGPLFWCNVNTPETPQEPTPLQHGQESETGVTASRGSTAKTSRRCSATIFPLRLRHVGQHTTFEVHHAPLPPCPGQFSHQRLADGSAVIGDNQPYPAKSVLNLFLEPLE